MGSWRYLYWKQLSKEKTSDPRWTVVPSTFRLTAERFKTGKSVKSPWKRNYWRSGAILRLKIFLTKAWAPVPTSNYYTVHVLIARFPTYVISQFLPSTLVKLSEWKERMAGNLPQLQNLPNCSEKLGGYLVRWGFKALQTRLAGRELLEDHPINRYPMNKC